MPMDRCVKIYPVSEHELTTIGTLTFASSFCIGVASIALGAAIAVAIGVIQELVFDATKLKVSGSIFGVLIVVAAVFYIAAGICACRKKSEWSKIKSEAVEERVASTAPPTAPSASA